MVFCLMRVIRTSFALSSDNSPLPAAGSSRSCKACSRRTISSSSWTSGSALGSFSSMVSWIHKCFFREDVSSSSKRRILRRLMPSMTDANFKSPPVIVISLSKVSLSTLACRMKRNPKASDGSSTPCFFTFLTHSSKRDRKAGRSSSVLRSSLKNRRYMLFQRLSISSLPKYSGLESNFKSWVPLSRLWHQSSSSIRCLVASKALPERACSIRGPLAVWSMLVEWSHSFALNLYSSKTPALRSPS